MSNQVNQNEKPIKTTEQNIPEDSQKSEVKVDTNLDVQKIAVADLSGKIDLNATLNKIRSEEKKKYQADIDRWKKEAEEAKKVVRDYENSSKSDVEKLTGQLQELTLKISEQERKNQEYENSLRIKDLEIYKSRKLIEAGNELIPELVIGNTVEEIDLALELSKKRYQDIVSKVKVPIQTNASNFQPSNPISNLSKQDRLNLGDIDIKSMSLEDYKKNREQFKKSATNVAKSIFA